MDTQSLTVPAAVSGNGSGRNKVELKPGHSLMDWIRYTNSGKDLTSTGGKTLHVSPQELAKHNNEQDAWIALKGKVYNITPYLDYHPGGSEELMRGAGKDATDLFNQIHRWVNAESMLQKCFVGYLKKSWSLEAHCFFKKPSKMLTNTKSISKVELAPPKDSNNTVSFENVSNGSCAQSSTPALQDETISIRLTPEGKKIILAVSGPKVKHNAIITELSGVEFLFKLKETLCASWFKVSLPCPVTENYEVQLPQENKDRFQVTFCKEIISSTEDSRCLIWNFFERDESSIFWPSKLIDKVPVNYNTYLFTFLLPPNVKMWIPMGFHVCIKTEIEEVEVVRSYTPVLPLEYEDVINDGSHVLLMVKIYPSGTLTPVLNFLGLGETLLLSNYHGAFSENLLIKSDFVLIVAAGTGITPMIKIIRWILNAEDKKRSTKLLFFNKTEDDIIWKTEFDHCSNKCDNFEAIYVLSEPSDNWNGFTGTINEDILRNYLPSDLKDRLQILVCGPIRFTEYTVMLFKKLGVDQSCVFTFTG